MFFLEIDIQDGFRIYISKLSIDVGINLDFRVENPGFPGNDS